MKFSELVRLLEEDGFKILKEKGFQNGMTRACRHLSKGRVIRVVRCAGMSG